MDFGFTDDEIAFDRQVVEFLALEQQRADACRIFQPQRDSGSQLADLPERKAFMKRLAAKGWLGLSWPTEYGGYEHQGPFEYLLNERLSQSGAPLIGKGVGMIGRTLMKYGSEKLKKEFLPKIIAAEVDFALGYSEPEAGSDLGALKLRADRTDGGWILHGQKRFSTSAHFAEWYWVAARTDPRGPKHHGITLFLVELNDPALIIHEQKTMGDERTNEVFFDHVFVPNNHVVGEVDQGWTYVCEALDYERFTIYTVGALEAKFSRIVGAVRAGKGRLDKNDPLIRHGVAELASDLEMARLAALRVVDRSLKGATPTVEASICKLTLTRLHQKMANWMMDNLGAVAVLREGEPDAVDDGAWEHSYRYSVLETIGGGATEIQKNILARRALKLSAQ
ncbi:alkylation response protein AidB-like acyl-CoA dehydrogenase [Mycobacteroides chelonae]|nr:alkylation response protein AidB-like acyl-CoA dehydrogenase [Mycobacteroides chelonae]